LTEHLLFGIIDSGIDISSRGGESTMQRLLSVREVSERTGLGRNAVLSLIYRGELKAQLVDGWMWAIEEKEIQNLKPKPRGHRRRVASV